MKPLSIAQAFSRTPGSRYRSEGDFSGEEFRQTLLVPALRTALADNQLLEINLDGTAGYGTSFLEEAFGGLIRVEGFRLGELLPLLRFVSQEEPYLVEDIVAYMEAAEKASRS